MLNILLFFAKNYYYQIMLRKIYIYLLVLSIYKIKSLDKLLFLKVLLH